MSAEEECIDIPHIGLHGPSRSGVPYIAPPSQQIAALAPVRCGDVTGPRGPVGPVCSRKTAAKGRVFLPKGTCPQVTRPDDRFLGVETHPSDEGGSGPTSGESTIVPHPPAFAALLMRQPVR